jgi:hypothetical protein
VQRQVLEPVPEYATELETQQNLGAENEHPSFVEGSFDEYGKHLEPTSAAQLTRISQRGRCIGLLNLRKSCCSNGLSRSQGKPDADRV